MVLPDRRRDVRKLRHRHQAADDPGVFPAHPQGQFEDQLRRRADADGTDHERAPGGGVQPDRADDQDRGARVRPGVGDDQPRPRARRRRSTRSAYPDDHPPGQRRGAEDQGGRHRRRHRRQGRRDDDRRDPRVRQEVGRGGDLRRAARRAGQAPRRIPVPDDDAVEGAAVGSVQARARARPGDPRRQAVSCRCCRCCTNIPRRSSRVIGGRPSPSCGRWSTRTSGGRSTRPISPASWPRPRKPAPIR
jgi:hypothetical protein